MARPDFQGGYGRLGYSTLYGRLLNEGPYGALELGLDVLKPVSADDPWATVRVRMEGGSLPGTDGFGASLAQFRVSQFHVEAGNLLGPALTFRLGTLVYFYGDLGLYDVRPATLFDETLGLSAQFRSEFVDVLVGFGDSGFFLKGAQYSPILTAGAGVRVRLGGHLEFGAGGQVGVEPFVEGSKNSSYVTPGIVYADYLRKEVVQRFFESNPGPDSLFPRVSPSAVPNFNYRAVGYMGFGKLGPLKWNSSFVAFRRLHPELSTTETFQGRDYTLYIADLTRDRYRFVAGNEMLLSLWPERLDLAWSVMLTDDANLANAIQAGEDNRRTYSTVLRLQLYLTRAVHVLLESSLAQERSKNGNLFRTRSDSVFRSTGGQADTRGLEFGDSAVRNTWQMKSGLVLNPTGFGIYARPAIRLLYGFQYSTQNAAWPNGFVDSLSQFNEFPSADRRWHHVISLEAEGWF